MMKSTEYVRPFFVRKVSGLSGVNSAYLMNLGEVNELTWGYPKEQRKHLRRTWIANGFISRQMLAVLMAAAPDEVIHEIMACVTPNEGAYAVISTQLGNWQHRFLMPIYEHKVVELLTGVPNRPLSLSFTTNPMDGDSILYRDIFTTKDCRNLACYCSEINEEKSSEFAARLPLVTRDILHPNSVPSVFDSSVVRAVEVSVLVPSSYIAGCVCECGTGGDS